MRFLFIFIFILFIKRIHPFLDFFKSHKFNSKINQLFIISIRIPDFLETIKYYELFMPYITKVLIITQQKLINDFKSLYKGNLTLEFIPDEELMPNLIKDHLKRNFYLRTKALSSSKLDNQFIMADDDNRPIKPIPKTYFTEKGKDKLYYFYTDISKWAGSKEGIPSSFDLGQYSAYNFIKKHNWTKYMFASHEPQIIRKEIYLKALKEFPDAYEIPIDEWTFYGNYVMKFHSKQFIFLKFTTILWPEMPTDWLMEFLPDKIYFENYYHEPYQKGRIFQNLYTEINENVDINTFEKEERFYKIFKKYYKLQKINNMLSNLIQLKYGVKQIININFGNDIIINGPPELFIVGGILCEIDVNYIFTRPYFHKKLNFQYLIYNNKNEIVFESPCNLYYLYMYPGKFRFPLHGFNQDFKGNFKLKISIYNQTSELDIPIIFLQEIRNIII